MRIFGATVLAAVLVLSAGACGSDGDGGSGGFGDSGDDGDFSLGPTLTVTFDVSGETTLKGEGEVLAPTSTGKSPESCADYAAGSKDDDGKTKFTLPELFMDKVGGKQVMIQGLIPDYRGPGDYGPDDVAAQGVSPGIVIEQRPFVEQPDNITKYTLTISGDGGGKWEFTRLAFNDGSGPSSEGINGTVTWTCKD